uniref:hypothetical protein n=1 Tax=Vulcanisaeta souniana TaxID=164452 RepID=UPI000AA3DC2E
IRALLGLEDEIKRAIDGGVGNPEELIHRIKEVKVADLACGSGTLLTASYSALMNVLTALKHYSGLDLDLNDLGKALIEEGIYGGVDALKYAAQVTAINLA